MLAQEPEVLRAVRKLLHQKRNTPELGLALGVPLLNEFIEAELDVQPADAPKKSGAPEVIGKLDSIFHNVLAEYEANKPLQARCETHARDG